MRSFASVAIAISVLIGCGEDTLSPSDVAGDYRLTSYDGASPPLTRAKTDDCDILVRQGSLNLGLDSLFQLTLGETLDCTRSGRGIQEYDNLWMGPYSIEGTTLRLRAIAAEERVYKAEYHGGTITVSIDNSPSLGEGTRTLRFGPEP